MIEEKEMIPEAPQNELNMSVDQDIISPLLHKDKADFMVEKALTFDNTKLEIFEEDKHMEDASLPPIIDNEINIKMEIEEPKSQMRRKSVKRRSRKSVLIEFSHVTNELKVIINKIKGDATKRKVHKTVTLKNKKQEKSLSKESKETKTPIK
jgi:cell division protein FtsB